MANKKSNADIDIEDMTNDQLKSMDMDELGELLGKQDEPKPLEDTTAVVEEEPQTEEPVEEEAVTEEQPEEVIDDEPELIRGKTREDVVKMWKDAQSMISKQGNEKHEFKKELQELRDQVFKPKEVQEKKDELMDKLADYNQDDIEVIKAIFKQENQNLTKAQQDKLDQELSTNAQNNESFWSNLEIIDPILSAEIKEDVLSSISKDKSNTLQKEGWLQTYVINYKASKKAPVKTKVDLTTKKLKAKTAGSGGQSVQPKKAVKDMSPEEYADSVGLQRMY